MRRLMISLFVILTLSADLKITVYPYIHWVAWLVLILPIMLKDFIEKGFVKLPFLIFSVLMFFIGFLISSFNSSTIEPFIQFIKFSLVFITIYYIVFYKTLEIKDVFFILNLSAILNFALLMIAYFNIYPTAQILTGSGRWGTILNYPGSLVKIGSLSLFYNVLLIIFNSKDKPLFRGTMVLLSIVIINMDGSRTGFLLSLLLLLVIPIFIINKNHLNNIKMSYTIVFLFIISLLIIINNLTNILGSRLGVSIISFWNANTITEGLQSVDSSRFMMINSAISEIIKNPIVGNGSFSTIGVYSSGSEMVVHNTYLQVWGDYGLLGLTGYMAITFSWIPFFPTILKNAKKTTDLHLKSIIFSSILMLIYFNINGLFHPYSTEFAEWMTFIIPAAAYFKFYRYPSYLMKRQ
ncbi:O-antigen ligase family protein [Sporosarcina siberiensis]|uniref:O-antigen ligase family protein n=1 Tax=Sporosarcina siberiensis TaxID=1365606 RepID=A0ABW4SLD9_9BACL